MPLNIDIVSDFVCPWCFIGKVRLQGALDELRAQRPELDVRINWLPYFLNPDTPPAGEPYRAFLEAKFGGAKQVDAMHARVAEAGAPDVSFAFERMTIRPNTLRAHRLMYRAQAQGRRQAQIAALADALFAAHFLEGRNIGDIDTLADIAAACGDKAEAVRAYLESDADVAVVRRMAAQVQQQGVTGVPFFILNRKLAVSGAQSVAAMGAALLQALE